MDLVIFIVVVGIAIYWIFIKNTSSATRKVTIVKRDTVKTDNGTIDIEEIIKTDERKAIIGVYDDPIYKEAANRYRKQQERVSSGHYNKITHDEEIKNSTSRLKEAKPSITLSELNKKSVESSIQTSKINKTIERIPSHAQAASRTEHPRPEMGKTSVKVCENCKKTKDANQFFHSEKNDDGLTKWCRQCLEESRGRTVSQQSRHYKVCPKCQQRRLKTNFEKNTNNPDGLTKWCRYCLAKRKK